MPVPRQTRNVRAAVVAVCALLLFGNSLSFECSQSSYAPMRVTEPSAYPYSVLIVKVRPKPITPEGLSGTVISVRWILTRATIIFSKQNMVMEWGVMGANMNSVKVDEAPLYLVESIYLNPHHNISNGKSPFNLALLLLKRTDENIKPITIPDMNDVDKIDEVSIVYWMAMDGVNGYYNKYVMPCCEQLSEMRLRCPNFNRESQLCLATSPEGDTDTPNTPCSLGAKSVGGGIVSHNRLLGVYMGIDNEDMTGIDICGRPSGKKTFYHAGVRIQMDYDPTSPHTNWIVDWLIGTQDVMHTTVVTTTITTTTPKTRLTPATLWQYCVSAGEHSSRPFSLILVFVVGSLFHI